jgi:hypothetical protein
MTLRVRTGFTILAAKCIAWVILAIYYATAFLPIISEIVDDLVDCKVTDTTRKSS